MLRKLRAVAIIALAWALMWLFVGIVLSILDLFGSDRDFGGVPLWFYPAVWSAWGAISGAAFALLLSFTESGRTISSVSLWRIAAWGALGSMALPLVFIYFASRAGDLDWRAIAATVTISAVLGAVSAAGLWQPFAVRPRDPLEWAA